MGLNPWQSIVNCPLVTFSIMIRFETEAFAAAFDPVSRGSNRRHFSVIAVGDVHPLAH